jgi:hypothetical protein
MVGIRSDDACKCETPTRKKSIAYIRSTYHSNIGEHLKQVEDVG